MFKKSEDIKDFLMEQVKENGESISDIVNPIFKGNHEDYLNFLVAKEYISERQKSNWIRIFEEVYEGEDDCEEYSNIEAMTYSSPETLPYDVVAFYKIQDDDDGVWSVDLKKARELGLINTPIFIVTKDIKEYHDTYWEKVIPIISEYLLENIKIYEKCLSND